MFRIGVSELGLACALLLLILFLPPIIKGYYAQLDRRLKNIEKKIDKKEP